jgi:hypothetical protein
MLFGTASFLSSIFRPKCRNQTPFFPRPCCGVHPDRRGRCQLWRMAALATLQRGQPVTGTVSVPACQRNTRDRSGLLASESASERPTLLNSSDLPCHCLTHNRPELPLPSSKLSSVRQSVNHRYAYKQTLTQPWRCSPSVLFHTRLREICLLTNVDWGCHTCGSAPQGSTALAGL